MPTFSRRSKKNLAECHDDLQTVANYAIKHIDFTVIEGHRGKKEQDKAFSEGNSKLRFPHSKHNQVPSLAFDFIPYPFKGWNDLDGFTKIGHMMLGIGAVLKDHGLIESEFIYGGDWQNFVDFPHFEIR